MGESSEVEPKVGMCVFVCGVNCCIFKVHSFGTIDVVSDDGDRAWRITGLWRVGWRTS